MNVLTIAGLYLAAGIIALTVFDIFTGRVRLRLKGAAHETQVKLAGTGSYIGTNSAMILTVGVLVLFWPLVLGMAAFSVIRGWQHENSS
jgi:hypothetical protein